MGKINVSIASISFIIINKNKTKKSIWKIPNILIKYIRPFLISLKFY